MKTEFQMVADMNTAFGNPKGNPKDINFNRIRKQCLNILDEYKELMLALGVDPSVTKHFDDLATHLSQAEYTEPTNLDDIRDALCDIRVFNLGASHLMGIDAYQDMTSVIDGVLTRFIKNDEDKEATIAMHKAKGVENVYFEGDYPLMVMKSSIDQPDAPRGKFLKSASYKEPTFYKV